MKTPLVLRRAISAVIFGAFASLSITGCDNLEYLTDESNSLAYAGRTTFADGVHLDAGAQNGSIGTHDSDAKEARAICTEGSMAECEAACNGGRLAMCITLAQELHAGARVAADPVQADRVLARACNGGRLDACLQRGVWIEGTDVDEAADLFMRGCQAERTDSITTQMSCGMWMTLLDAHVYEPNDGDEYAGLSRICALEESGALVPGSNITDGSLSTHYVGGACGRLKDLGMAAGSSNNHDQSKKQAPNVAAANPWTPKW